MQALKNISHYLDIITEKVFVELLLLLLLGVLCLYEHSVTRITEFNLSGYEPVKQINNYSWSIDDAEIVMKMDTEYCRIKGWVVEYGIDAKQSKLHPIIILQNLENGIFYKLPTKTVLRKDVTKFLFDGNDYNHSGFEALVPVKRPIIPKPGNFHVYLFCREDGRGRIIDTGSILNLDS